jgi:hypothetical protein
MIHIADHHPKSVSRILQVVTARRKLPLQPLHTPG